MVQLCIARDDLKKEEKSKRITTDYICEMKVVNDYVPLTLGRIQLDV